MLKLLFLKETIIEMAASNYVPKAKRVGYPFVCFSL